jgi:hypothetical protein
MTPSGAGSGPLGFTGNLPLTAEGDYHRKKLPNIFFPRPFFLLARSRRKRPSLNLALNLIVAKEFVSICHWFTHTSARR